MNQSIRESLIKLLNVVLMISLAIALLGFWVDVRNTIQHGGVDLRNRVVGARLLIREMDPYHFQWSPDYDEQLLDPMVEPGSITTRVTVPPNVLLIHAPFANMPYFYQRMGWLIVQWVAFVASLLLFISTEANPLRQKLLASVGLLLFSTSMFWRMHVERGQIYIIYVFLIALAYWVLSHRENDDRTLNNVMLGGGLIGLAASLRFPIFIMVLPMLVYRQFRLLAATLASFGLFLLGSVSLTGKEPWKEYISALAVFKTVNRIPELENETANLALPKTIEGMTNLSSYAAFRTGNFSIQEIVQYFSGINLQANVLILLLCVGLLGYIVLASMFRVQGIGNASLTPVDNIFLMGGLMILMADLFVPAPRFSYNDVQLLIPLLLIFKQLTVLSYATTAAVVLLIISLLIGAGAFDWLPYQSLIAEYMIIGVMLWISLLLLNRVAVRKESTQSRQYLES